jgi:phage repressor protein C with HTH and peptisase S24 domain
MINSNDPSMFALHVSSNNMAPNFVKGDLLVVSPETWSRSGDIAAVEYGNETPVSAIMQVTYSEDFIVLESVNHKNSPIALVRGKDHFRIIGRVIHRYQSLI